MLWARMEYIHGGVGRRYDVPFVAHEHGRLHHRLLEAWEDLSTGFLLADRGRLHCRLLALGHGKLDIQGTELTSKTKF